MHFYHLYLVVATDKEEARSIVENRLEPYGNSYVWDYFGIQSIGDMKLRGSKDGITLITKKNLAKAKASIKKRIDYTKSTLAECNTNLAEAMRETKSTFLSELGVDSNMMIGFHLKRLGNLISGQYSSDTYFYDWAIDSPHLSEGESVNLADGRHYLVEVDLHN